MFCIYQAKTFLVLLLLFFPSKALSQLDNEKSIDPIIKSFLMPGWGQRELGYKDRSKLYNYVEVGIIITMFSSLKFSNEMKRNYIAYASEHAGIIEDGKDH